MSGHSFASGAWAMSQIGLAQGVCDVSISQKPLRQHCQSGPLIAEMGGGRAVHLWRQSRPDLRGRWPPPDNLVWASSSSALASAARPAVPSDPRDSSAPPRRVHRTAPAAASTPRSTSL